MTPAQAKALQAVARAVIESCDAAGEIGAPGGVIYAALMSQGCTLHQYEQIMSGLTRADMLTREGECYTATPKGRAFAGLQS